MRKFSVFIMALMLSCCYLYSQSNKTAYSVTLASGVHFAKENELFFDSKSRTGELSIGKAKPGIRIQSSIEAKYPIGRRTFWTGSVGLGYSLFELDNIISGSYIYIIPDDFFAPTIQKTTTLQVQFLDGVLPITIGWYLDRKGFVSLEVGLMNQVRLADWSEADINDINYVKTITEVNDNGVIRSYFEFLDSPETISSKNQVDLKSRIYEWGILAKIRCKMFYMGDTPLILGASYIHYPTSREFWEGQKLKGRLLISLSIGL